jgi:hypothetical protein
MNLDVSLPCPTPPCPVHPNARLRCPARLGALGGAVKSKKKTRSSRRNARKGGRPVITKHPASAEEKR